jgi:hypothetical protein
VVGKGNSHNHLKITQRSQLGIDGALELPEVGGSLAVLEAKGMDQVRKNCPITVTYSGALSGTVTDFTACSLPPPLAFTFDLLPKSDDMVLFYFVYLHMSKSHLHVFKSLFISLPLLQTTVYVPHSCIELLWRHFIKKDVTGRIYASITPHL